VESGDKGQFAELWMYHMGGCLDRHSAQRRD